VAAHHDDHELIEQLLRLVREHPELREALRRELLSEDLLALPARVDQRFAELAQRIEELAARMAELADRITFLATRQERTEAGLARLDERLERLEARADTQVQAIAALLDAQQATERQLATLAERMAELADRQAVTEQRLAQLAARMDALTERMERVEAQIAALTARIDALTARMEQAEQQIANLTALMERVEAQIASLTERMDALTVRMEQAEQQIASLVEELRAFRQAVEARFQRVEDRLGVLSGFFHYTFYLHRLASILGHQVRRLRADQPGVLLEPLADRLGPAAYRALLDTDLIARGRLTDGREVWLVIEVSAVVDEHDVERALTRAALLRRAVPLVLPAVAGSSATEAAEQLAAASGVIVVQDGLHPALDPLLERWAAA